MKKLIIASIIFLSIFREAYCQDHAYIKISVSDNVFEENLILRIWNHFTSSESKFDSYEYDVQPTPNLPFEINIDNVTLNTKLKLESSRSGELLSYVPIEPGDSVVVHIHKLDGKNLEVTYSGRGSSKFYFLDYIKSRKPETNQLWSLIRRDHHPQDIVAAIDSLSNSWVAILDEYSNDLSPSSYNILKANILGQLKRFRLRMLTSGYGDLEGERKKDFEKALKNVIFKDESFHNDDFAAFSEECIHYLYEKEKVALLYLSNPIFDKYSFYRDSPYSFSTLISQVQKKYDGKIRDQLLGYCVINSSDLTWFFNNLSPEEYENCMDQVVQIIKIKPVLQLINHQRNVLSVGQAAYDFELPLPDDSLIRLSDFKGKIVLLDFWGVGCTACLSFKRLFESKIYPHLKENPDFVFISLSIEKKKEVWLESLSKYSHLDFVNVSLHGPGNKHSIFQHYNIRALPFIILIDRQGKIISSLLPRDEDKLLHLIQSHL